VIYHSLNPRVRGSSPYPASSSSPAASRLNSYLMTRRIEHAMALLRRDDKIVTEVCPRCSLLIAWHLQHPLY